MMLSQRYLKTEYLKRYVGGLVQFDGSTSHIDFLGFWADHGRTASLFERTPFLWKRCASNRKLSRLNNGTMCRGLLKEVSENLSMVERIKRNWAKAFDQNQPTQTGNCLTTSG